MDVTATLNKTLDTLNMPSTKIIKNRGPRIEPWGTPHFRVCSADSSTLMLPYFALSVK